jgi:inositol transport system substrate-binding protein
MDAIVIVPVDTSATAPMTKNILAKNIKAVYVNRNPGNLPDGAYYVGSEEIVAGRLQMEFLGEKLKGKGSVAILMGKLDNEGALKRTAGNEEVKKNKYPDIKILDKQTGQWQRNEGLAKTEDWLNRFGKDLKAILANNDDMALGAIQALKDKKRTDIIVVGVDATPDALTSVSKGELAATVFQDAAGQGGGGIEVAMKAAKGEKVAKETWIPFKLVTPDNLAQFKK